MKKSISIILVISMVCVIIPFSVFAQEANITQTIDRGEMMKIVESIESEGEEEQDSSTAEELQETLNSTEGITSAHCEETTSDVDIAVEKIYDDKYQSENADKVICTEEGTETYTTEIYEDKHS